MPLEFSHLHSTGRFLDRLRLLERKDLFGISAIVDIQIDRLGKIQAEDTHDGFCVDDVSAGNKVEIGIKLCKVVYKRLHFIDGV